MTVGIAPPWHRPPAARTQALVMEGAFTTARRVRALAHAGRPPLDLSIGEPSFATPAHIVAAGVRALARGDTRYAPPVGLPELRDAIADDLRTRGIDSDADRVIVTPGAKPALLYAVLALVDPGDEVLVPDPGFPIYPSIVRFAGGRPVRYADPGAIAARITPRTRVIVINSPHNPTGSCASPAVLEQVAELALRHDLMILTDEIYSRLWFGAGASAPGIAAIAGLADRTVVVDGFSKTWAMTGWRLGFASLPSSLVPAFERLVVNAHSCVPPFVQRAGIAALTGSRQPVRGMVRELRRRRELLVNGLNAIDGIRCPVPAGAFYAFADLRELLAGAGTTDTAFADGLLDDFGVAVLPGSMFGPGGGGHLRLSFAAPGGDIVAALGLLRACVDAHITRGSHR